MAALQSIFQKSPSFNILIVLLCVIAVLHPASCKSISAARPKVKFIRVPLTAENKTLTQELESRLAQINNGPSPDCSTRDDLGPKIRILKNGVIDPRYRWTGTLGLTVWIDPEFNSDERKLIQTAMERLGMTVGYCITLTTIVDAEPPSGLDYVHIKRLNGCWSYIGRQGGAQELSLGAGCLTIRLIVHELVHALGIYHEQARPDRDDFITINWENIEPGKEHNFEKLSTDWVSTFGIPYNTRSIMHYNGWAFSSNGQPTILAKDGGQVGSSGELQDTDIEKLKRMYNCQ